jgi:NAD(P)H dehydrogenase (quinone)
VRILVVLAHPSPESLNHAIAARAVSALETAGHEVALHDLYAEGFDPVLPAAELPEQGGVDADVLARCRELAAAEGIVIGSRPASRGK